MKKNILLLVLFLAGSAHAYKGERCIDAAILSGVRSIQCITNNILGKVCTILEKVCDIQECTPIPITQPLTITESGSYCLATSLQSAGAGSDPLIIIDADVVSLDFASHTLDANGADHALSITGHSNVVIFNGSISNAAVSGLVADDANQVSVEDMNFQGNANGLQVVDSCEIAIISSGFRGTTPGAAVLVQTSTNVQVIDSTFCENTGSSAIVFIDSVGTLIDPTLIAANAFTGSPATGVLFDNTHSNVIRGLQVDSNTGSGGFIGVSGINGSSAVEISDSVVRNCSAPTLIRGFDAGADSTTLNWVWNNCTVSNINFLQTSLIDVQGIRSGGTALVNNCVVSSLNLTGTNEAHVDCYLIGGNSKVTNNMASTCQVGGNSEVDPAGSFLNGFRIVGRANEVENNMVVDLIITPTVAGSAGYEATAPTDMRLNLNNATRNRGMAGFLVDTAGGNLNSLFENQASNNLIGITNADYRVVNGVFPVIRVFDVSAGAFTATPEPFDNIQIVP